MKSSFFFGNPALTKVDDFLWYFFIGTTSWSPTFLQLSLGTMFAPMAAMFPMFNVPQNLEQQQPRARPATTGVQWGAVGLQRDIAAMVLFPTSGWPETFSLLVIYKNIGNIWISRLSLYRILSQSQLVQFFSCKCLAILQERFHGPGHDVALQPSLLW